LGRANKGQKAKTKTKVKTNWKMHAYYLDACNCDWGCPCQFNAKPTHNNCEGVGGFHIIDGNYGNIKLDRLNMAWTASFPGPVHEGDGRAAYYIDNSADDIQFDALSEIMTGRAGGGPFAVYANVIEEYEEPRKARITFQAKGTRSHVKVGDNIAEAWLEPIRNPVTGQVHRAIIEIPGGFEASRMDQASMKKLIANDDSKFNFEYKGTYGSFSEARWKGP
jgi:hypothetical protein